MLSSSINTLPSRTTYTPQAKYSILGSCVSCIHKKVIQAGALLGRVGDLDFTFEWSIEVHKVFMDVVAVVLADPEL